MKVTIIYGSVRDSRLGFRAALFLEKQLQSRGIHVTVIDPKVHQLPLLNKMYKDYPKGERYCVWYRYKNYPRKQHRSLHLTTVHKEKSRETRPPRSPGRVFEDAYFSSG